MRGAEIAAAYLAQAGGDHAAALLSLAEAAVRMESERDAYARAVSSGMVRAKPVEPRPEIREQIVREPL